MSVQVFVDGFDGRPLPTNSIVKGEVHVKIKKSEQRSAVSHVVLDFYGRSKVHITRRQEVNRFQYTHHHRFELEGPFTQQPRPTGSQTQWRTFTYTSKCLLFAHQHMLGQSRFQIPASRRGEDGGTLIFPFEFRIPTHSEPQPPPNIVAHSSNCFSASGCFPGALGYDPPDKIPPPQPLPDTMNNFDDNHTVNNRGTASLSGGGSKLFGLLGPAESTVDIPLYNPAALPPGPIQHKRLAHEDTVRTLRLLPSHQTTKLSFRDNMRSVFKKDRLPWFAVGITFQAPDILWLDQPADTTLPFVINVRRLAGGIGDATGPPPLPMPGVPYDEKGRSLDPTAAAAAADYVNNNPDHVPTPQVFLKRLELKLVAHTALRGGDDRFSGFGPKHFEGLTAMTIFDFKASRSTPQVEVPVGDSAWLDLGAALGVTFAQLRSAGAAAGIGGITSEFLTPNVWRRWGVEWDMRLECVDEETRWRSETAYGGGLGLRFWRGDGVLLACPPTPEMPAPTPAPASALAMPHIRADESVSPSKPRPMAAYPPTLGAVVPPPRPRTPEQQQLSFGPHRGHTPIDPGRPSPTTSGPGASSPANDAVHGMHGPSGVGLGFEQSKGAGWDAPPPAYTDVAASSYSAATADDGQASAAAPLAALDLNGNCNYERDQRLEVVGLTTGRARRGSGVSELAGGFDDEADGSFSAPDPADVAVRQNGVRHGWLETETQTLEEKDGVREHDTSLNPWSTFMKN